MLGCDEVFVCPVQQGVTLAFFANGFQMVGVSAGEQEDAGHENKAGENKCKSDGHVVTPFPFKRRFLCGREHRRYRRCGF